MNYQEISKYAPEVTSFFDPDTNTVSYVVADTVEMKCAVIDTVMSFDPVSGRLDSAAANPLVAFITEKKYHVEWILETHVHADHLSAAGYMQDRCGGTIAIGDRIIDVQSVFGEVFNESESFKRDGSQFDKLWADQESFMIGSIPARVLHVPGHTPADVAYVIGDAVFVGDTLFMPDVGSARCDFPGGSAEALYQSVQKLYELPDDTRMFLCHDYLPEGREAYTWATTIGEQKRKNIHMHESVQKNEFVSLRTSRDETLSMPRLIIPSIQYNMRAGRVPPTEANGVSYFKTPVNGTFAAR